MKTDNSINREEKYQEGYYKRCTEIDQASLIIIEGELFELTPRQLNKFKSIRLHSSGENRWHKSLDYIRENCISISKDVRTYNY